MMEIIVLIVRCLLAGVFAVAAVGKFADLKGAEKATRAFGVPEPLARPVSYGIPIVEAAIAAMLLFPQISVWGAVAAAVLLTIFVAGMAYQLAKGNAPDCHCFGQIHSEPVGISSIVRNVVLLIAAGFLIIRGFEGQGMPLAENAREAILLLGTALSLMVALAAVLFAKNTRAEQMKITRRVEMLEVLSGEESLTDHSDVADPNDGLPVGAPLPEFEISTIGGEKITSVEISGRGRSSLLLFVGPDCNPCASLSPEIEEWVKEFRGKLDVWLVSRGEREANLAKFNGSLTDRLLLQVERETAELLRARWTPTAVLVGPTGRIASNPAVGDNLIRELIDKIRYGTIDDEFVNFRVGPAAGRKNFVGKSIPEFSAEDIHGAKLTDKDLIGKKALVIFLSKNCGHCTRLAEEIARREHAEDPKAEDIFIFSNIDIDTLKSFGLRAGVVHDEGFELAKQFGMFGSPSAVLLNKEGRIISESAIGAPNIWALRGEAGGAAG